MLYWLSQPETQKWLFLRAGQERGKARAAFRHQMWWRMEAAVSLCSQLPLPLSWSSRNSSCWCRDTELEAEPKSELPPVVCFLDTVVGGWLGYTVWGGQQSPYKTSGMPMWTYTMSPKTWGEVEYREVRKLPRPSASNKNVRVVKSDMCS